MDLILTVQEEDDGEGNPHQVGSRKTVPGIELPTGNDTQNIGDNKN